MLLHNWGAEDAPGFYAELPEVFSSIEEARNSKDYLWNTCMDILICMESDGDHEEMKITGSRPATSRLACSRACGKWLQAFRAFLQIKNHLLDKRELQAAHSLEINQIACTIFLDIGPLKMLTTEMGWDAFTTRYERIVDLAALVVEPAACGKRTTPEFSLDMDTVGPLFSVAYRCRHPVIRRKAIALLYAAPRQEGCWNSILAARVAEEVVGIEEEGLGPIACAADVPERARLCSVNVEFDRHGRISAVSYNRRSSSLDKSCDTGLRWTINRTEANVGSETSVELMICMV